MTHNLLTLPREIRNIIYPHLSGLRSLDWPWPFAIGADYRKCKQSDPNELYNCLRIRLDNAPDVGALLTHSRLRDEYQEELAMQSGLSATIVLNWRKKTQIWLPATEDPQKRARAAFARLKHVMIFVECRDTFLDAVDHSSVKHFRWFLWDFLPLTPNLETLRVAFRAPFYWGNATTHKLSSLIKPAAMRTTPFLPILRDEINGLGRVQRGEGYLVGFVDGSLAANIGYAPGQNLAFLNPTGEKMIIKHKAHKVSVWAFVKHPAQFTTCWTQDKILEQWPVRQYPEDVLPAKSFNLHQLQFKQFSKVHTA